jgi:Fic family protein
VEKIDALHDWRDEALTQLLDADVRGVAARIVEDLFGYPLVTATLTAERCGVSYQAANTAIRRLVQLGILEERTGRRYGRIFAARRVLNIINTA